MYNSAIIVHEGHFLQISTRLPFRPVHVRVLVEKLMQDGVKMQQLARPDCIADRPLAVVSHSGTRLDRPPDHLFESGRLSVWSGQVGRCRRLISPRLAAARGLPTSVRPTEHFNWILLAAGNVFSTVNSKLKRKLVSIG